MYMSVVLGTKKDRDESYICRNDRSLDINAKSALAHRDHGCILGFNAVIYDLASRQTSKYIGKGTLFIKRYGKRISPAYYPRYESAEL